MNSHLNHFLFFFLLSCSTLFGQNLSELDILDVFDEKIEKGVIGIYAENKANCPVTVVIDFPKKLNIEMDVKLPYTYVVPANTPKQLVMELRMKPNKKVSFQYGYTFYLGDGKHAKHDDKYVYQLPFPKGQNYLVGQGYHGRFSHFNMNAIDFNMNEGSKICAARGGIVAFVKEDSHRGCKNDQCRDDANYILIYHDDGSFSQYVHLKKNGSLVEPGQKIEQGDVIGYSGNTGWSSGPHLHFEVFIPNGTTYMTLPTKFKTEDKAETYLEEGKTYGH